MSENLLFLRKNNNSLEIIFSSTADSHPSVMSAGGAWNFISYEFYRNLPRI